MAPVLRVGDNRFRAITQRWILRELPVDLSAEVQSPGKPGRSGFFKARADPIIVCFQRVGTGVFVVQYRSGQVPIGADQRACGTMGRHGNGVDPVPGVKTRKRVGEKFPDPVDIKMRIGRRRQDRVGPGNHGDLGQLGRIDKGELGVCLADVDDRDVVRPHGMWNMGVNGTATGSLSGFVSIRSDICAHQRFMTAFPGKASIV